MDFTLSPEQQSLHDEIVHFARTVLNDGARQRDQAAQFDRTLWRRCGELKLPGLAAPVEFGGRGLDPLSCAMALEALGYGCVDGGLTFALGAHLLAGVVPIWKHGSDQQRRHLLPKLCDGTWIAANAMTEPGAGSDVFSITTRAERDGDGFRLSGCKTLITNAPLADLALVFAVTNPQKGFHGGLTAFVVDLSTAGVTRGRPFDLMSVRSCHVGELQLDGVLVPETAAVGGVGGGAIVFNTAMDWERSCLFALHVGGMERLLETAVKRARTRTQFGQPIGKFEAVSHRLADMKVRLEAARLLVYRAAWRLDRIRTVSMDASMAKLFASESLVRSAMDVLGIHGGAGLLHDGDIERSLRDAVAGTIYSGTSDIQRSIIARWLGV
jgi:alkylation response protein AidB-like acyl-CoA dehydrogenase